MAELSKWTTTQVINQLNSGYKWSGSSITYTFPTLSTAIYGTTELGGFYGFNSVQQGYATLALSMWDDIIAPSISYTSGVSNIEFANSTTGVEYAHAYYPSIGSVWMSANYSELLNPTIGKHSYVSLAHEIGHALGLDHSGNYNGSGTWKPSNYYDSTVYTIMSYFGPSWGTGTQAGYGLVAWADWIGSDGQIYSPQTPMLHDIMTMQSMYGVDTQTRIGDTVYGFNTTIDDPSAAIFDFSLNMHPILTLYDAGGEDTLDVSGWLGNSIINLNAGSFSSGNAMTNNIAIAFNTIIENGIAGSGNDTLIGNSSNNILDGGSGADKMSGGNGNDTYIVDDIGDSITETSVGGVDTVKAYIHYTLGVYLENLTLMGSASLNGIGNTLNNIMIGNSGSNILNGGAGNDRLDGGVGADTMLGGAGNDTYVVDNGGDVVSEMTVLNGTTNAGGVDTVETTLSSYTLGLYLENLTFVGISGVIGTGNSLNNIIIGTNSDDTLYGLIGNDTLRGGEGDDILEGGAGNDILDGGVGADRMIGGAGNDTYVVDSLNDEIIETSTLSTEIDTVQSSISWTLENNLENLTLIGTSNLNGTGNSLKNSITGNSGNNVLNGGAGADTMIGGGGDDIYIVDNTADKVIETVSGGNDTVHSSITYTLSSYIETLVLSGTGNINGLGNTQNNTIIGNSGNNIINGGLGPDTLTGNGGSDKFYFTTTLSVSNIDKITDFTRFEDMICLDDAIFKKVGTSLDGGEFISGYGYTKGLEADDRIIYNTANGGLYYDSDGSGTAVSIQFAVLIGIPGGISHTDFAIV